MVLAFRAWQFSAMFRTAFAADLIAALVRIFIASLTAIFVPAPASPVNTSLTLFTLAYSPG